MAPLLHRAAITKPKTTKANQAQSEYKHSLTFRVRDMLSYITTKPMYRLQIRPTVHNLTAPPTIPPSYIWVRAVVWAQDRQTHTHTLSHTLRETRVTKQTNIHFTSSTTHAKRNNLRTKKSILNLKNTQKAKPMTNTHKINLNLNQYSCFNFKNCSTRVRV